MHQDMSTGSPIRLDIQGLRALAVLAVIVFHMQADWLPGGFLGVDVFFVVSGFVVSRVILQRGDSFSWLGFYANRLRRIVPAYVAMLLVVALLAAVFLVPDDFKLFEKSMRSALLFISNQYFAAAGDYFAPAVHEWPLLHTWSLAVEMQFYLLLPLILRLTPRRWLPTLLGILCIAGFSIAQSRLTHSGGNLQPLYYAMTVRAPEFLMGAWAATVQKPGAAIPAPWRMPMGLIGLALMLGAFVLLDGERFSPLAAIWPCAGALLLMVAQDKLVAARCLSHPWLVLIGALSYSLYLWHWPLLALARYVWQDSILPWSLLGSVTLSFSLLAWLSWRFVEQPWLRPQAGLRLATRTTAVTAMVVASFVATRPLNAGIAPTPPQTALRYASPDSICHGQIAGGCQRGAPLGANEVLLFGDSHAAQLNLFMDAFGQAHGVRATVLSASSCVPFPGFEDERLVQWAIEPCRQMQKAVEDRLPDKRTLIVAGKWSYQTGNPAFLPAFSRFLEETDRRMQRVVVLAQLPMMSHDPVRALRMKTLGIQPNNAVIPQVRSANAQVEAIASRFPRVAFADFSSSPLFASLPFRDNELIYMDRHHLNEIGSVRYAQYVGKDLAQLVAAGTTPSLIKTR